MNRIVRAFQTLAALVVVLPLALAVSTSVALAHERRAIGPYQFVVGFIVEPAVVSVPNGVDLRISEPATNEPVVGAEIGLRVEVRGPNGTTTVLPILARGTAPGAYIADYTPALPGQYTLRFVGAVGATPVDATFTSGPGTFGDVVAPTPGTTTNPPAVAPVTPPAPYSFLFTEIARAFGGRN